MTVAELQFLNRDNIKNLNELNTCGIEWVPSAKFGMQKQH